MTHLIMPHPEAKLSGVPDMEQGIYNPRLLLQDCDRKLFAWFVSRIDAPWVLRRVLVDQKRQFRL
jgi:succinate dehydrogenase flavin-adding protein (antitoxin of CptAB toxin-antitoxin module)